MEQSSTGEPFFLEFLPNPAREDEGLGHAGIQTYRNDPFAAAAREPGQNSRDVAAAFPVRMSYDVLTIPRDEIPAINKLQSVIEMCLHQSTGKEKETDFFRQALHVVSEENIRILRISDYNTTGANGPSVPGAPFHSLVMGSGVSVKNNADSGGSFGIGKNAAFAVSDLQSVFYSTVYEDNGSRHFLAQGKAILISHNDIDKVPKRQTGYWGLPDFGAIDDQGSAPPWLRRTEVGTSVFVLGFRDTPDWQHRIMCSLIENFFPAIHNGEMEFSLDNGQYQINNQTLLSFFDDPVLGATAIANDREQEFDSARNLYRCLVAAEAKEEVVTIPSLGRVQVRVLVENGLPKKIAILRNGMVITDSLEHFGDAFARFPMYRDFVAVVTPLDSSGSAFIKTLEDPKHKELSPEGLANASSRAHAKTVMKALAKEVRRIVKEHALTHFDSEVSADEMTRYFAAASASASEGSDSAEEDPQKIRYKVEPDRQRRQPYAASQGANEAAGGSTGGGSGPRSRQGNESTSSSRYRHPPGGKGRTGRIRTIPLEDVRNMLGPGETTRSRTIYFTPAEGGDAEIVLQAVGLNENDDLLVVAVTGAAVSEGRIKRQIVAGERVRIDVEFANDYNGPVDVRVNVIQETVGEVNED